MILADSGFWVALLSARDRHHAQAIRAAQQHAGEALITTWPVLTEASYLIARDASLDQQLLFLRQIGEGGCALYELSSDHLARMTALMHKYRDLPMDLADASLVVLAEELGEGRILSTDERDFRSYKWKNRRPFKNLLLPA